jgi:hypothetical protein
MAGESRDMTGWFSFKMYSETGTYSVLSFYLLYVYVWNNPLKYIDPTGHVKIDSVDTSLLYNKIDVLSPIEGTYLSTLLAKGLGT